MRKARYDQVMEAVRLLYQAHDEIRNLIEKADVASAAGLLADCQDSAIAVGTLIEQSEGEDCEVIPAIEDYCEQVYLLHEQLVSGGRDTGGQQEIGGQIEAGKVHKFLQKQLIRIENSISRAITVRREVVFLPYKASMWDSLESVWRAADADEGCDAYVVPIPYYDKNPDGSFGVMHYEGNQYPDDVPVVDYRDYDLAKRRPDVIYIHNPYDQFNLVTSVEPFYYAKNLKHYTEKLVYIPYFVLSEVSPDDEAAVKSIEHFVTQPGVIYADKVIVQSEDMRKAYIKVLVKTFGAETKVSWEKKILGTGSPKFDKVLNMRREDLEIPAEWLRIIEKPDGSRKKVVLYNTGVSALLYHSDKYLIKMQDVFRLFRENANEIALLWRPHPLMQATICSMRPHLRETYNKLLEEYRSAGWGIYDDSAELERAIAVSDAYYGDESSVVQLCQRTNMPILLQNSNIIYDKNFNA